MRGRTLDAVTELKKDGNKKDGTERKEESRMGKRRKSNWNEKQERNRRRKERLKARSLGVIASSRLSYPIDVTTRFQILEKGFRVQTVNSQHPLPTVSILPQLLKVSILPQLSTVIA